MNFSCQIKGSLFSLSPCCCYHSCQETKGEELFFLPLLSFLKGGTEKGGSGKKKTLKIARRPSFSSSSAAASLPSSLFFLFRRERTCFLHPFSAEKEEVGWGGFYPLHWRREWFCREGRRGRLHPRGADACHTTIFHVICIQNVLIKVPPPPRSGNFCRVLLPLSFRG